MLHANMEIQELKSISVYGENKVKFGQGITAIIFSIHITILLTKKHAIQFCTTFYDNGLSLLCVQTTRDSSTC